MTNNYSKEILIKKDEFDHLLESLPLEYKNIFNDKAKIQQLVNKLLKSHVDLLNLISNSIGQSHQEKDFLYNPDLRKDYLGTTESFLESSFKAIDAINLIIAKHNLPKYQFENKSYFTLQKMINSFSNKEDKRKLKQEFEKRNISIVGFNHKFKKMKQKYLNLQLWIGIPFVIAFFILAFLGESLLGHPFNGIQLIGLKALLALSFSIVGSSLIEGSVETDWTLTKGLTIRAVGWVAVFLLLYFINPANPGDVY